MSKFADAYSRYLTNHFDYINKYKTFRKYFKNSIISLTEPKFMSKSLIDKKADFPKYPYFLNAFVKTESIDLVKIYNTALDSMDSLVETMVGSSEIAKKGFYDSIPTTLDDFLSEINFQYSYVSTPSDLYNYNLIIRSFISEYEYRNFFSDLYTPLFHSSTEIGTAGLEDKSFIYQYMLYSSLYNILFLSHDIYSKSLAYLKYINAYGAPGDRVDQTTMLADFQSFVTSYSTNISIDLAGIIGKTVYGFQNISEAVLTNLKNVINTKINDVSTGLYKSFYDYYYPLTSLSPDNFIANQAVQQLNAFAAVDFVSQIFDDITIVDEAATEDMTQFETDEYTAFMEKMTEADLKNYLFLCFLYKFWPVKFLNVLQLTVKEYVENIIKTVNDETETAEEYGSSFVYFSNNKINYTNLKTFLDTSFVPSYLYDINLDYNIGGFSCVMFYIYLLNQYFESDNYDTFVVELSESIFIYLRDNGHIDYTFNWYEYHDAIDIYLKTYLRWKLLDQSKRCTLSNYVNAGYKFENGSTIIECSNKASWDLIPIGDYIFSEKDSLDCAGYVDSKTLLGDVYVLVLSSSYSGQTTEQDKYNSGYTYTSTDVLLFNTVTNNFSNKLFPRILDQTVPPAYQYVITIPTATLLQSHFNSYATTQSFIRSMHQFNENLMLSTLTREIIYSVLSNFII